MSRSVTPPPVAHPVLFHLMAVGTPVVAAAVLATAVVTTPSWPVASGAVAPDTLVVVLLAVLLVVFGDVLPVLLQRSTPQGIHNRLSATFTMALLVFAGPLASVVAAAAGVVLLCLLRRIPAVRILANVGFTMSALLVGWQVLTLLGRHADLVSPWTPRTLGDVLAILLATLVMSLVNDVLVLLAQSTITGRSCLPQMRAVLRMDLSSGTAHHLAVTPVVVVVMGHYPALMLLMVLPVTAAHRALVSEERSRHTATHDELTGLANRARFVHLAEEALEGLAEKADGGVAVVVVDLDGFKQVNDVLGHPVGDRVLVEAARRLRLGVREGDVVARTGGDEFAVVLPRVESAAEGLVVAQRLHDELRAPCEVDGHVVDLGASIGVAVAPEHGSDFDTLYSRADQAMFKAKRDRGGPRLHVPTGDGGAAPGSVPAPERAAPVREPSDEGAL